MTEFARAPEHVCACHKQSECKYEYGHGEVCVRTIIQLYYSSGYTGTLVPRNVRHTECVIELFRSNTPNDGDGADKPFPGYRYTRPPWVAMLRSNNDSVE